MTLLADMTPEERAALDIDTELAKQTREDAIQMKIAGRELAAAASYLLAHGDGVHWLHLAISKWHTAIAGEGGRRDRFSS